jgi:hypothetical protein
MRKGEKFDFWAKKGIRQDLEDRIGLKGPRKQTALFRGPIELGDYGKFSIIPLAQILFIYKTKQEDR